MTEKNKFDEILEKHAEAMGGKEKWEAVETMFISMDTGDGGVMDAYTKKPDKFKLIMRYAGYEWVKSWNGKTGWILYNGEEKEMTVGEAREMAEEPDFFDELIFAKDRGYEVNLLTREKLEGVPVYKLQVVKAEDDIVTYYVNANTYLIVRIDEQSHDPKWVNSSFSTLLQDYKEWQGMKFPGKWGIIIDDAKPRWMKVFDIVINEPMKDSVFEKK